MNPVLRVQNLQVVFGGDSGVAAVLEGVTFSIGKSEIVGLMGPSGSGKSTLALSILGLLPPSAQVQAGSIFLAGRDLLKLTGQAMREIRGRRIGLVFQNPSASLNPVMRIDRQLCEGMRHHLALSKSDAISRATGLLREVGIRDPDACMMSYPYQLSGGMQQRVIIAAALSCRPDLLICDEPTSALDVTVQAGLLHLFRSLTSRGLSVLFISHDRKVVEQVADRQLLLSEGRVTSIG